LFDVAGMPSTVITTARQGTHAAQGLQCRATMNEYLDSIRSLVRE